MHCRLKAENAESLMLSVSPGVRLELGWGGSLRAMNERSCKYCIVFPPERDMDDPRVPKAVSTPPHDAVNTTSVPCAEARMTLLLTWLWPFYPFKRFYVLLSVYWAPGIILGVGNTASMQGSTCCSVTDSLANRRQEMLALSFCSNTESAVTAWRRFTSLSPCRAWLALMEKPPSCKRSQ